MPVRLHLRLALRQAIGIVAPPIFLVTTLLARVPDTPTFTRDVAPILYRNCIACHHPGANGAFSLLDFDDVRPRAKLIAAVTQSRYMPPWKPEPGFGEPFLGTRGLTDDEITTLARWAQRGASQGDPSEMPPASGWNDGWPMGTPDLIVPMPEPYELRADSGDVFRTFVFPIPITSTRYVKAIQFMPGTRAIHHANMRVDETPASRELDDKDPAPGYDGLTASSAHYPDGYFFGWTPGQVPQPSEQLAWRLNPGTDMVLQLHLRPTHQTLRVQPAIGFYFASQPPRLTPIMLRLGKQNIDIPPDRSDFIVTDTYRLPANVDVQAVQPHAHYLARRVEGFATLPDGTTKWLILIRDWDFDWQDTYRYEKPFRLPKDTTITMRYTYDNSMANRRNPSRPPRRVQWGQNSSDEMGDLWIQVVPASNMERDTLYRDFRLKVFQEDILGYEMMLRRTPDDIGLHDDVALLYTAVGKLDQAVAHFAESTRLSPGRAVTHFNLGTALAAARRFDEAIAQLRMAINLDPKYEHAFNNLGSVLLATGEIDEAFVQFQHAVELDPRNIDALNNLGSTLTRLNRLEDAMTYLRRALEIDPNYPDAHYNLARTLAMHGDATEAARHYQMALALRPDWPQVRTERDRFLSAHPELDLTSLSKKP